MFLYQATQVNVLADDVSQIFLQPTDLVHFVEKPFFYEAGQYVNIHYDEWSASLSIACAPRKDHILEFHLSHSLRNVKAQKLLQLALQKQPWSVTAACGYCTANRLNPYHPIIFLAYETGFAPIKAVIEVLTQLSVYPSLYVYWMGSNASKFYLTSLLDKWKSRFNIAFVPLIVPERNFSQANLFLPLLQQHTDFSNYQIYASGPRTLIQAAYAVFIRHGLKQTNFYSDMLPFIASMFG